MKKLSFLLTFILILFVACSSNNDINDEPKQVLSDPDNIAYKNNAIDSGFVSNSYSDYENYIWYYNGYERTSGTTGIIGKWKSTGTGYTKYLEFKTDGTFTYRYESEDTITNREGTFLIFIKDSFYTLHLKYSNGNERIMKYVCSDSYFCGEGYNI